MSLRHCRSNSSQGHRGGPPRARTRAPQRFTTRRCCVLSVTTRTGGKSGAYKSAVATATDASLTPPSRSRGVIRVNVPSTTPLNLGGGASRVRRRLVHVPSLRHLSLNSPYTAWWVAVKLKGPPVCCVTDDRWERPRSPPSPLPRSITGVTVQRGGICCFFCDGRR